MDGTLAGTYILDPVQGELYDRVAWGYPGAPLTVHALAVDQAYQGQGIASLALEWAEAIAIRAVSYTHLPCLP